MRYKAFFWAVTAFSLATLWVGIAQGANDGPIPPICAKAVLECYDVAERLIDGNQVPDADIRQCYSDTDSCLKAIAVVGGQPELYEIGVTDPATKEAWYLSLTRKETPDKSIPIKLELPAAEATLKALGSEIPGTWKLLPQPESE